MDRKTLDLYVHIYIKRNRMLLTELIGAFLGSGKDTYHTKLIEQS